MKTRYFYPDGTPVPEGKRVQPQGHVDRFIIDVESSSGVTADEIRDLIQSRRKVQKIVHDAKDVTVTA
jgi:hypothetical protein